MTRINLVHPSELCDQHLFAEFREITRIPNLILSNRFNFHNQPSEYTLGKGHVKFFYDKLDFLHKRYASLWVELTCIRQYNVIYIHAFAEVYRQHLFSLWDDYIPNDNAVELSKSRIIERMPNNAKYTNRNPPQWSN